MELKTKLARVGEDEDGLWGCAHHVVGSSNCSSLAWESSRREIGCQAPPCLEGEEHTLGASPPTPVTLRWLLACSSGKAPAAGRHPSLPPLLPLLPLLLPPSPLFSSSFLSSFPGAWRGGNGNERVRERVGCLVGFVCVTC
jgi:hypothetical protein